MFYVEGKGVGVQILALELPYDFLWKSRFGYVKNTIEVIAY